MTQPTLINTADRLTDAIYYGRAISIGAGSVTSVDVSGGTTGLTTSGGPVTGSGVITIGGTLGVGSGGTGSGTTFTQGSVLFAGASGVYSQDNANFFWDATNHRLGIGTATPAVALDILGVNGTAAAYVRNTGTTAVIVALPDASGHGLLQLKDTSGTLKINLLASGESYFDNGNVRIGAAVASALLTVGSASLSGKNAGYFLNNDASYATLVTANANATGIGVYDTSYASRFSKVGIGNAPETNATLLVSSNTTVAPDCPAETTAHFVAKNAKPLEIVCDAFGTYNSQIVLRGCDGTAASPSASAWLQWLGSIQMTGRGTTQYGMGGGSLIGATATSSWSDTSNASDLRFYTTPSSTINVVERVRIGQDGSVKIGTPGTMAGTGLLEVKGTIEIASGSGGGLKFEDGSIQYTAVGGTGGLVPSTRLINTTAPLAGGGDLSADRTLSIAIDATNDGGAVALQTAPSTSQTGELNVSAGYFSGQVWCGYNIKTEGNTAGQHDVICYNTNSFGGDHSVKASFVAQTANGVGYFENCNTNYTGTGARQANTVVLLGDANVTGGLSIAAQASAPIRFYAGGVTANEERVRISSTGLTTINTSGTWNAGLYPLTVTKNVTAPTSFASDTISHFIGVDGSPARVVIDCWANSSVVNYPVLSFRAANGTAASPSAVQSGYAIMAIRANGYGTSAYGNDRVAINGSATEAWTNSAQGTRLIFSTTPTGGTTLTTGLIIDSDQSLRLGSSSDTYLRSRTTNTLNIGAADSATPVDQAIQAMGSRSGTDSNIGGANFTITSGIGTGTGTPSALIFQVPVGVGSGSGIQTATKVFQINGAAQNVPPIMVCENGAWLKEKAGHKRITGDATNATATFSNLTDFTITVVNGEKYFGRCVIFCTESVAAEGIKFDFNGGTATVSSFECFMQFGTQGTAATMGVMEATSLATALTVTNTGTTTTCQAILQFGFVVSATGTIIPRFAQNSHTSGTATVKTNSYFHVTNSAN